jgi:hypothetical protein
MLEQYFSFHTAIFSSIWPLPAAERTKRLKELRIPQGQVFEAQLLCGCTERDVILGAR